MPPLTRWFLKAALVYLVLALCMGIFLALPNTNPIAGLFPIYFHMLTLGWLTLILINAGVFFIVLDTLFEVQGLTLAGRAMEILGLITFVTGNWRRIKPFES